MQPPWASCPLPGATLQPGAGLGVHEKSSSPIMPGGNSTILPELMSITMAVRIRSIARTGHRCRGKRRFVY